MSLATALRTDMSLPKAAQKVKKAGRGKDTLLAHINPREAAVLKKLGGSGKINPKTGIMEFDDGGFDFGNFDPGTNFAPSPTPDGGGGGTPSFFDQAPSASMPASGGSTFFEGTPGQSLPQSAVTPGQPQAAPTGFMGKVENFLSEPSNLAKIGLGAGGLGLGLYSQGQAQKQGAAAQQQIAGIPENLKQLAAASQQQLQDLSQKYQAMVDQGAAQLRGMAGPLMEQYNSLVQLTNQGKLSPANQQVMEAARARIAQDAASRGGVGAEQSQGQLDRLYNTLLASQMQQALQIYAQASPAQVAATQTELSGTNAANQYATAGMQSALNAAQLQDQYALTAIQTGLNNDAQARQSMNNFYASLAAALSGTPTKVA